MTLGIILGILGLITLFVGFNITYNQLYTSSLSMDVFFKKVREHGPGYSWKMFWWKLQGELIDMRSKVIITSGGILLMNWETFIENGWDKKIPSKAYETTDGILYGTWAAPIRPARGYLQTFLLKTPGVGALMTMSFVNLQLSDLLAKKDTAFVLQNKADIGNTVGQFFGGDDEEPSSSHEKRYGIVIGNPQLFNLDFGEKSQAAVEKYYEVKEFNKSMIELEDQITDPEKRSNTINIVNGIVKKNIYDIEGLVPAVKTLSDALISVFTKKS